MGYFLGLDVGTVSLKIAVLTDGHTKDSIQDLQSSENIFLEKDPLENTAGLDSQILVTEYYRIRGNPVTATLKLLNEVLKHIPANEIEGVRICGSGGDLIGNLLNISYENEFRALARGVGELYPNVASIFEMGGQNSKYILLERDEESGRIGISDYEKSGDCAAGTGSFLDQQALRLKFDIEDVGDLVSSIDRSAKIAGRCSVFAKSDMIHAQQKGHTPAEVLGGLCEAVARNYKSSIIKGKKIKTPVAFVGGVAANTGVSRAMLEVFNMSPEDLFIPKYYAWMSAIGTAFAERDAQHKSGLPDLQALSDYTDEKSVSFPVSKPLSMDKVMLLRDKIRPRILDGSDEKVEVYLGVDVGSVSTNLVIIDDDGNMIKEIYTRTDGRPIEVVDRCLTEIEAELGDKIVIKGVGSTGSGRELIGELLGADSINDEITAHKTGAEFLARKMLDVRPDTIFEIGGQDSKYISLENGIVVDFAMNEACAAGTGSFLEERAEELNISIKDEFSELALSSKAPIKLGERCTVFMQQDVAAYQQKGAKKEDLTAGLAYSIVYNYLNRVVRGRKIGKVIFFQGGTAYNNAIASAFAQVLDCKIIVPPYNGVIGAVGAALLALEKTSASKTLSGFRGFNLDKIDYTLREFTCKACSNFCNMQEFTVEGEKTFWGDQCSDKFRRRQTNEKKPVIENLLSFRREILFEDYNPDSDGKKVIGLPRGMYIYEQFPFWNAFFSALGYKVLLSDETNSKIIRKGIESSVAEPCLPIQAYHGHVEQLLSNGADHLFVPNMINAATPVMNVNSHYCPWGQTLPFVVKNSPAYSEIAEKIISPSLRFRSGKNSIIRSMAEAMKPLGEKKKNVAEAVDHAFEKQHNFNQSILAAGEIALDTLKKTQEIGIVLVGRTYNINDRGMTLDIGSKLRDYYGVNVIPMDFLPLDSVDISDINPNMYWNYGRKILAAAKIVGLHKNLHIIYLTNFKCGPDSYIKHYIAGSSNKPFLSLQFDGHSNDAGYITRCEAYLDSKGALRWWTENKKENEKSIGLDAV